LLVATAGTGGTICGIARKIKEKCPNCIVVGVDPVGSILAQPDNINGFSGSGFYEVEGIGYDFLPTVLDRKRIDYWFKSFDKESFQMSRKLIKREGLLCGGSCGSAVYCAVEGIKKFNLKAGQNVVVLLPDSIRNYMTKYLSDEWMITRDFLEVEQTEKDAWWVHQPISTLKAHLHSIEDNIIDEKMTISTVLNLMKSKSIDCVLVLKENKLENVITKKNIMAKLVNGQLNPSDLALKASLDRYIVLKSTDKLKRLQCSLDSDGYALIADSECSFVTKENLFGVASVDEFLSFITSNNNNL